MKEKLQEYALIAEIIGGIAIVFSLVFVGLEMRRSTNAEYAASLDRIMSDYFEWKMALATDENFRNAMVEGVNGVFGYTASNQGWEAYVSIHERVYFSYIRGALGESEFQKYKFNFCLSNELIQNDIAVRLTISDEFNEFLTGLDGCPNFIF